MNPAKLNKIATDLGLDVARSAKPEATIARIRDAVKRAEETAGMIAKQTPAKK